VERSSCRFVVGCCLSYRRLPVPPQPVRREIYRDAAPPALGIGVAAVGVWFEDAAMKRAEHC